MITATGFFVRRKMNSLYAAQFAVAFDLRPDPGPALVRWGDKSRQALDALILFRSHVHKWQAAGALSTQQSMAG